MNNFDFLTGETANYLSKVLGLDLRTDSNAEMSIIETEFDKSYIRIGELNKHNIALNNDNEIMFMYLARFDTTKWKNKFPVFHTTICSQVSTVGVSKYSVANRMPVHITCKVTHKKFVEKLRICAICNKEVNNSFLIRAVGGRMNWYDAVIYYVENSQSHIFKSNGYISNWSQYSEAIREKKKWKCEKCNIKLEEREDRKFLHVHHKNGNKEDNRYKNLEALCVCCHAMEHKSKLEVGDLLIGLHEFYAKYKHHIRKDYRKYLEKQLSKYGG